jgi:hydrogenase nickel incorporation protein HypB
MLLNKVDLLPYLSFDSELAIHYARQVNPALQVIALSATSGEGFAPWLAWLKAGCAAVQAKKSASVASLRQRIAELEARLAPTAGG